MDTKSSCPTLSTAASHSSTALSLSYLTPASSVASCRSQSQSPRLTGTIQPYLRRPRGEDQPGRRAITSKHDRVESVHSYLSRSSATTSSSSVGATSVVTGGREADPLKQTPVSVPMQASSSVLSFKTSKSSSAPSLRQRSSTSNLQSSSSLVQTATARLPVCDQGDVSETESSPSTHSVHQSETTSSTDVESSRRTKKQLPQTLTAPQGSVVHSSVLPSPVVGQGKTHPETTAPPSHLPSRLFSTGVKLPPNKKQPATISLAELDRLWMDFLASSLGSDSRNEHLPGSKVLTASPPAVSQPFTLPSLQREVSSRGEAVSSETRDAGIQTTPSLTFGTGHKHHTLPQVYTLYTHRYTHPPTHTSPTPTHPHTQLSTAHQLPCLSGLTLQESLKALRPDFIRRCEQRQSELRKNHQLRSHTHCEVATGKPRQHCHSQHGSRKEAEKTQRSPHFVLSMWLPSILYNLCICCVCVLCINS